MLRSNKLLDQKTQETLGKAVALQGATLTMAIFEHTKIKETILNKALAKVYGLKSIDPQRLAQWNPKSVKLRKSIAERYPIAMLAKRDRTWIAACADPDLEELHSDLPALLGGPVELRVVTDVRLAWMRAKAYDIDGNLRMFALFSGLDALPKIASNVPVLEVKDEPQQVMALTLDGSVESRDDGAELISEDEFNDIYLKGKPGAGGYDPDAATPVGQVELKKVPYEPQEEPQEPAEIIEDATEHIEEAIEEPEVIEEAAVYADEVAEAQIPESAPEPEPAPVVPLTRDEAIEALSNAGTREELADILLGFARNQFERAALLSVDGSHILGWSGSGSGISNASMDAIWFGLDQPSVFKTVCDTNSHFIGPLMDSPVHDRLLNLFGGEKPESVFVMPLLYEGSVSQVLWLDNGDGQQAGYDISDILILAVRVPNALEAIVAAAQAELS